MPIILTAAALLLLCGLVVAFIAPGTDRDEFFWQCFCDPSRFQMWWDFLMRAPWLLTPGALHIFWPVEIRCRSLRLHITKRSQLQIGLLALILVLASPSCSFCLLPSWSDLLTPPSVGSHGSAFCSVCDHTWSEKINFLLIPLIQILLFSTGAWKAIAFIKLAISANVPVSKQKRKALFSSSICFLSFAIIFTDILMRYSWAEDCIHQGFH